MTSLNHSIMDSYLTNEGRFTMNCCEWAASHCQQSCNSQLSLCSRIYHFTMGLFMCSPIGSCLGCCEHSIASTKFHLTGEYLNRKLTFRDGNLIGQVYSSRRDAYLNFTCSMTEQGCLQAAFTEDTFSPFQENFELPFSQHGLLIESREALENGLAQIVYLDGDDQAAEKTQFLQSEPVQAFINNIYPVARE